MTIPFKVKLLTKTAKAPEQANEGDLYDLFADGFCDKFLEDCEEQGEAKIYESIHGGVTGELSEYCDQFECLEINHSFIYTNVIDQKICGVELYPNGRILVKTGISLELPVQHKTKYGDIWTYAQNGVDEDEYLLAYAVADLRPRSGLALKHGVTVLNAPATIDNSYRKEIGVILYNAGHATYTIKKSDKIAQMLIRPLYPSKMEIVEKIEDTARGGYGSTGK